MSSQDNFSMEKCQKHFIDWLVTQQNANGFLYSLKTATSYVCRLRVDPLRLEIPVAREDRNVFKYHSVHEFERLYHLFINAGNFNEVNRYPSRGSFSSALHAYKRYLASLEGQQECVSTTESLVLPDPNAAEEARGNAAELAVPIPEELLAALRSQYPAGFRFEATSFNLLGNAAGLQIGETLKARLKSMMFSRKDGLYFLLEQIADNETCHDILAKTDDCLKEYGCFELSTIFQQFAGQLNKSCIKSIEDFEDFYIWLGQRSVRTVIAPRMGIKIVRKHDANISTLFGKLIRKILSFINDHNYGSCSEEELQREFPAFSAEFLAKIIRQYAPDDLIRASINDIVFYQGFPALGLPANFADILNTTLVRLEEIGLTPSQEALHVALCIELNLNLKSEFNLLDWDSFRRLISHYYTSQPRREWKNNIFLQLDD